MDNVGQTFNRWTILSWPPVDQKVLCKCQCGTERLVFCPDVKSGKSKSCGCHQKEIATKHGLSGTGTRNSWRKMISRCFDSSSSSFHNYGGRGISVCRRWLKFENFVADMGLRPTGMTLDRINNEEDYSPTNCRWATRAEQARNRRTNKKITFNGVELCATDWSKRTGLHPTTITSRLKKGLPVSEVLAGGRYAR